MDKILLQNSIRLLIGGYLYDTNLSDDIDEMEKLLSIPSLLNELADDYKKEIIKFEESIN